jgi:hypothetical protein
MEREWYVFQFESQQQQQEISLATSEAMNALSITLQGVALVRKQHQVNLAII